jgi:hypothetical protein
MVAASEGWRSGARLTRQPPECGRRLASCSTSRSSLPLRTGKQVLQPIGSGMTCLPGQLQAFLAGHRRKQSADVVTHAAAEFHTAELMADGHKEVVQFQVSLLGSTLDDHLKSLPSKLSSSAALSHVRGAVSVRPPPITPRPATLQPPTETRRSDTEILLEY